MNEIAPPRLPATPPATPPAAPSKPMHSDRLLARKRDGELPGFLKATAFVVGGLGALGGLLLAAELPTPLFGICAGLSSVGFAIGIYALGDIVLSLRRVAFNTTHR